MLEWYNDFLDMFVDRSNFEYIEIDTDSAYLAITAPSLEQVIKPEVIKPERKAEFDMRMYGFCHEQILQILTGFPDSVVPNTKPLTNIHPYCLNWSRRE